MTGASDSGMGRPASVLVCIAMGAVPTKSVSLYQLSCARCQTENSDIPTVNLLEDLGPEEDETP